MKQGHIDDCEGIERDHVRAVGAARTQQSRIDIERIERRHHVLSVGAERTQQGHVDIVLKALSEITYGL